MQDQPPLPIAVMISGGGTTLKNLLERIEQRQCHAQIKLVISSNRRAAGIQFAVERDIELMISERTNAPSDEYYSECIFEACRRVGVELIVLGGFLKRLVIPPDFENRVINIHPSLIPAFCGQGMYGMKVHQAVLDYGCKLSGCTVHFVDNEYDHGPIISQRAVPVLPDDTAQRLQQRIFREECRIYPEVVNWIAAGRVQSDGRTIRIRGEEVSS